MNAARDHEPAAGYAGTMMAAARVGKRLVIPVTRLRQQRRSARHQA
jgi:hypothetical protein